MKAASDQTAKPVAKPKPKPAPAPKPTKPTQPGKPTKPTVPASEPEKPTKPTTSEPVYWLVEWRPEQRDDDPTPDEWRVMAHFTGPLLDGAPRRFFNVEVAQSTRDDLRRGSYEARVVEVRDGKRTVLP